MSNEIPLIKPKQVTLKSIDGEEKIFNISRVPATRGREIFTQYIPTAAPKIGDYKANEHLMKMLVSFTEAQTTDGSFVRLSNEVLVAGHVPDWEMLVALEFEMVKYNTNFFNPEKLSGVLTRFNQTLPDRIMSILNRLSGQLSAKSKQR